MRKYYIIVGKKSKTHDKWEELVSFDTEQIQCFDKISYCRQSLKQANKWWTEYDFKIIKIDAPKLN